MLLTKVIIYKPNELELNILNSMAFASAKLWNIANYEKRNYKELGINEFPNWYVQKKSLKDNFWYKNLPSQTSQNLLDVLQKSWNSFFKLNKSKGIENPKPPRFKKKGDLYNFTYLNNGFQIIDDNTINFSISKQQKNFLKEKYSFDSKYLTLKINNFSKVEGNIKTIEFKPFKDNKYQINIVYEMKDIKLKEDNGKYLSIDIGISNLFTCYDNSGKSFIISGARFLEVSHYFNKKIAHYQSIANSQQVAEGLKYPKSTKRINSLYKKKQLQLNHYFHAATKNIVDYCVSNNINKVVIGDIKNIRKKANLGKVNNQKFHSLPYDKIYSLLEYKLLKEGIELIKIKENYSSQVSPFAPKVDKQNATKNKRTKRGLYIDNMTLFNADSVGAFNILRLYEQQEKKGIQIPLNGLSSPLKIYSNTIIKVAV